MYWDNKRGTTKGKERRKKIKEKRKEKKNNGLTKRFT